MDDITSIKPDEMYLVSELAEALGLGKRVLREARKQGLAIRYFANRSFVLGKDMIDHIMSHGRAER